MDIWIYYKAITRRLLAWSAVSVIAGTVLLFLDPLWRGVGVQAIAWGTIDAGIALIGGWVTHRRRAVLAGPSAPDALAREARNLHRILLINTGLNVLYVTGGIVLALALGADNPFWRGNGWASSSRAGSCSASICSTRWVCPGRGAPRETLVPDQAPSSLVSGLSRQAAYFEGWYF